MVQENKDIYFNAKKMFVGGSALSLATMSEKIIAFLLLPIFTNFLTPTEFGIVSISMVIVSFLSMMYNPGIISATLRLFYDLDSNTEKSELISSAFLLLILPAILVLIVSVFLGKTIITLLFKNFQFYPYGFLAVILAVMAQPIRLWSTIWVAYNKEYQVAKALISRVLFAAAISLLLVVCFKLGALGRLGGQLIGQVMIFIVVIFSIYKYGKFDFSYRTMKKIFILGFPLIFSVWGYVILDIGDRFLIERFLGLKAVGLYDVGYRIAALPLIISSGLNQVWTPILFHNLKDENYSVISKILGYFILFLTFLCGSLILFSREIFQLFINNKFYVSTEIIPYVTAGVFFLGTSTIYLSTLMFQKKFKTTSAIIATSAIINIVLNIILIPYYGIIGAAIATFLAYLFQNISGLFLTYKFSRKFIPMKNILIITSFLLFANIFVIFIKCHTFSWNLIFLKVTITFIWLFLLYFCRVISKGEIMILKNIVFGKLKL